MKIILSSPLAADSPAEEFDVHQVKVALNRLGYYEPHKEDGITGTTDAALFTALKAFQSDHGLQATGAVNPGDETVATLNSEITKQTQGQYIWRSVGDDKVRDSHAALDGTVRSWQDSPSPGEEINCRCWAEQIKQKINCDKEFDKYEEAEKKVKELTKKFNDLLLRLQELIDENNRLLENAKKSLGVQVVAYILTLPFDRIGILSELLRRYFGNIISSELLEAADHFVRQMWAIKQEVEYTKGQAGIVFAQLETAAKELEETRKKLDSCRKHENK
jgi:hypothetical protein